MSKQSDGHGIEKHKDAMGACMHRYKHHDPKPLHSGRGKKGKGGKRSSGPVVTSHKQAVAICLSIQERGGDGYSEDSLAEIAEMLPQEYADAMIRRKGNCPPGTKPKGKWCRVRFPDREFYIDIPKGESCPPGTKGAGRGYCVGTYSEAPYEYACPAKQPPKSQRRSPAQQTADQDRSKRMEGDTPPIPRKKRDAGLRKAQKQNEECR